MRIYEFNLPVYKQGDDFAHIDAEQDTTYDTLECLARQYEAAAEKCWQLQAKIKDQPKKVFNLVGDGHFIQAFGNTRFLKELVAEGLLEANEIGKPAK